MDIMDVCAELGIPEEVRSRLQTLADSIPSSELNEITQGFLDQGRWQQTLERCREVLAPDEDGMKILYCQLRTSIISRSRYDGFGISENVFIDTMKFFTRFLLEHKRVYGTYKYVWAWWAVRQLSLREFRIGSLEYELVEENGARWISIHIPSDCDLGQESLHASWLAAKSFFPEYFPAFQAAPMKCNSWLLAPSLRELLPESSRILQFQRSFNLYKIEEDSLAYQDWVFGRRDIPIDSWPEDTSLRRRIKAHVKGGGKIAWAHGQLIDDPFACVP